MNGRERKDGRQVKEKSIGRKQIHCPLCHQGRVVDVAAGTDLSRVRLFGPLEAEHAQLFLKCPKCGNQIGISLDIAT